MTKIFHKYCEKYRLKWKILFLASTLCFAELQSEEPVAKLHGSEKSKILGPIAQERLQPFRRTDGGLPGRVGEEVWVRSDLKGRFCAPKSFATGSENLSTTDRVFRRIQSHLLINDSDSALKELDEAFVLYPISAELFSAKIRVHARRAQEKEMIWAWKELQKINPGLEGKDHLVESMAWAVIRKGSKSPSPSVRAASMVASFLSQSASGVAILHSGMSDTSSLVRGIAVELSGNMRDEILREKVLYLLRYEKITSVRLAAIQAAGTMKLYEAYDDLKENLEKKKLSHEETLITVASLVRIYENATQEHVLSLLQSPRAALRLLGCEVVLKFGLYRDIDELKQLIHDPHPDVRKAAFQVLGELELPYQEALDLALQGLEDSYPQVAISAAWLLTLYDPKMGMESLEKWIQASARDIRLFASAALLATGQYGIPLSLRYLNQHSDPFVRVNLALHLIGQRTNTENACQTVQLFLADEHGKVMWKKNGIFKSIEPSSLKHSGRNDQNPEIQDQLTRLELLQTLAIMQTSEVQESVKKFLGERAFGITGAAAVLLLNEGGEDAIETVRGLLDDPNPKIRIQAALVLALWGRDESAIEEFANVYHHADREMKEKILEGLGSIGTPSIIPFLIHKLSEPHQNLRVIAASSILQSLYH